jgi:phosphoribosylamine--glycine ligase
MMRVLVVGGGGREHALAWKIRQSKLVSELYCAPGNPGTEPIATPVDLDPTNIVELADFAQELKIDMTVVGPEIPLSLGIADEFRKRGLLCFGPSKAAAQIEGSKVFAKEFMARQGIPTGRHRTCHTIDEAETALRSGEFEPPFVLKADGLAAGKGVIICHDLKEAAQTAEAILVGKRFGSAGDRLVLEEHLEGVEVSMLAFADGEQVLPLVSAQDFKRALEGDEGPNTGGMGSVSPSAHLTSEDHRRVLEEVLLPAVRGMAEEGRPYHGILYAGLMLTKEGPKVVEFNCRFGDPETQAILPRMASDIVPLFFASVEGKLAGKKAEWKQAACACVVLASGGYPGHYEKGVPIEGVEEADDPVGCIVFHAGTGRDEGGKLVTAGGRVLNVVAWAPSLKAALEKSYQSAERIRFEGAHFRRDIGRAAVELLEKRSSGEEEPGT